MLWFAVWCGAGLGCWIDLSDLDGDPIVTTCGGGAAPITWFRDDDGDGYGGEGGETLVACDPPLGFATASGDCDEGDATVNPATPETCNGADDDCDFQVDEAGATWCVDVDGDGYGDPADVIYACDPPVGYAPDCEDCDDGAAASHPGADEIAGDRLDNDCDGDVDEG